MADPGYCIHLPSFAKVPSRRLLDLGVLSICRCRFGRLVWTLCYTCILVQVGRWSVPRVLVFTVAGLDLCFMISLLKIALLVCQT